MTNPKGTPLLSENATPVIGTVAPGFTVLPHFFICPAHFNSDSFKNKKKGKGDFL